jgi:hypothetical protein
MKHLDGMDAGSTESSAAEENDANKYRKVTFQERWEELRYGPVGRCLGYVGAFILTFAIVTLILWLIERFYR